VNNLITIKHNIRDDHTIIIPDVILERTSKHALTIYVPAIEITDVVALDATGIERKTGHQVHRFFLRTYCDTSFFIQILIHVISQDLLCP
jgi:predicted unusual protein kinase regulating ubiquinone biosynthesis (AarF/ABC1/UbiB family)